MNWLRRLLFVRPKLHWFHLPAVCPRRFTSSEIAAALSGQKDNPQVQAMLQLLAMSRDLCQDAAQSDAQRTGEHVRYHLGGVAVIEDTLAESLLLLLDGKCSDDVRTYFPEQ